MTITTQRLLNDPALAAGLDAEIERQDRLDSEKKQSILQAKADRAAAAADAFLADKGIPAGMPISEFLSGGELAQYITLEDAFDAAQDAADHRAERR